MDRGHGEKLYISWIHPRVDSGLRKNFYGALFMWKALLKSFDVIGDGLAWKVGNGWDVIIGLDLWSGFGNNHLLPLEILVVQRNQGFMTLHQVVDPKRTNLSHQGWEMGGP